MISFITSHRWEIFGLSCLALVAWGLAWLIHPAFAPMTVGGGGLGVIGLLLLKGR